MLKLMVIAACVGAVLCLPKPGLEYEKPVHNGPFGMKPVDLMQNPFAQKLFSLKSMVPWLNVRTAGVLERDETDDKNDVVSYTRATGEWLGLELFGDFLYDEKNDSKRLGFGGGLGDLAKIYYNVDLEDVGKGYDLFWDAEI